MMSRRSIRHVGDLSSLPTSAQGARDLVWWGNISFMLIEGAGFLLAIGSYLYLQSQTPNWPPNGDRLPGLGWSGLFTACLLLSEVPNLWLMKQTRAKNVTHVRIGMLVMAVIGLILVVLRWFELQHLNVGWTRDAYGSVVWMFIVLHSSHVVTQLGEAAVLTIWLHTHEVGDDQLADVEDAINYWTFVVLAWLPIYALIYWVPRWV